MAIVTIERDNCGDGVLRSCVVEVDGMAVIKMRVGERVSFNVQPGDHELVLKLDWSRSNKIEFVARDDEVIFFKCGVYPQLEYWLRVFRREENKLLWLILDERKGEVPVVTLSEADSTMGKKSRRLDGKPENEADEDGEVAWKKQVAEAKRKEAKRKEAELVIRNSSWFQSLDTLGTFFALLACVGALGLLIWFVVWVFSS